MKIMNLKRIIFGLAVLVSVAGLTLASDPIARTDDDISPPYLPSACGTLHVGAGQELAFRTYAIGVQIYRWNGAGWDFVAPDANLYADSNYRGKVGIHYAGPTWESNSGGWVKARRLDGCTPDATAIPWLKLEKTSTEGPGVFNSVTYIQRVNTTGGLPPAAAGSTIGEEKRVPYTAEYYFYRMED